jgi:imidazolonepropionase-like amidohydrolase
MRRRAVVLAALLAAVVVGAFAAAHGRRSGCFQVHGKRAILFRGARVFDGDRVLPATDVLVVDRSIVEVGPLACIDPDGADVDIVPAQADTLLPGLIDAHGHYDGEDELERTIAFGVTTAISMGSYIPLLHQAAGNVDPKLADIYGAGMIVTAPGGHGTEDGHFIPTLASAGDAPAFVDARIAEGSAFIKLILDHHMSNLDAREALAVVQAAHARGKMVVAHVGDREDADEAVGAGVDGLAHIFCDQPAPPELVDAIATRRIFVIPTLEIMERDCGVATGRALFRDERFLLKLTEPEKDALNSPGWAGVNPSSCWPRVVETMHELRGKVPILAGTDAPNSGTWYGVSLHRELELLVQTGLTPVEALAAATSVPADVFGLKDRGRIAPGMRADLLLVEGDPTRDILDTHSIVRVYKLGARSL